MTISESVPVRRSLRWSNSVREIQSLNQREWLVTNGLGGYASGTISGISSRRYHGLLIAALPAPLGRIMLFNHLVERVKFENGDISLLAGERPEQMPDAGTHALLEGFTLEIGLPVWRYRIGGATLEKRLIMTHGANTVHLFYQLPDTSVPLTLHLRPGLHFRGHEAPVGEPDVRSYILNACEHRVEITLGEFGLKLELRGQAGQLTLDGGRLYDVNYETRGASRLSASRSAVVAGRVCHFTSTRSASRAVGIDRSLGRIGSGRTTGLRSRWRSSGGRDCSTRRMPAARNGLPGELVLAADQFIIEPSTRLADEARAGPPATKRAP